MNDNADKSGKRAKSPGELDHDVAWKLATRCFDMARMSIFEPFANMAVPVQQVAMAMSVLGLGFEARSKDEAATFVEIYIESLRKSVQESTEEFWATSPAAQASAEITATQGLILSGRSAQSFVSAVYPVKALVEFDQPAGHVVLLAVEKAQRMQAAASGVVMGASAPTPRPFHCALNEFDPAGPAGLLLVAQVEHVRYLQNLICRDSEEYAQFWQMASWRAGLRSESTDTIQ
jgi:hypothetical protein